MTSKAKTFSQWIPAPQPGIHIQWEGERIWIEVNQDDLWLPVGPLGQRPLYLLPEVLASTGKVAIVEGEKCVHACKGAWPNQTTVCWAGGTNAWQQTDWTPLCGS